MNIDERRFLEALDDDQKALEMAGEIYASCLSGHALVPGAEKAMGEYVQAISGDLYEQLELALEDPQSWVQQYAQLMRGEQETEHACALALMASLLYSPQESRIRQMLEQENLSADAQGAAECFARTQMAGAFACRLREYPCLEDAQVRRLALMLSAVFYGEWLHLCAEQKESGASQETVEAMAECADAGLMAVWGFAAAELLCSKESEKKGRRYVFAVSLVALACLPMMLVFDSMRVLSACLTAMFAMRRKLLDALKALCRALSLHGRRDGHLAVEHADEDGFDEQEWLDLFEIRSGSGAVSEEDSWRTEKEEDTDGETGDNEPDREDE